MKSKISLFKKGLLLSDLKRFWWVSALYAFVLFFAVPFNHYMQKLSSNENNIEYIKNYIIGELSFKRGASQYLLLVVPVVISVLVFRYIQKSRSASLFHSLPLTRTALYFNSVLSAVILFAAPLLFITVIMFLFSWFSPLSAFYTSALIFTWLGYSLLFGIMFIAMTAFVGMFTGNSIAQIAFVYILNALPLFLVTFVGLNLKKLLFGFDTYSDADFVFNMPMLILFKIGSIDYIYIIVYVLITAALFIGGLLAFKIRRPETAGDIITFRPVRPIFIYGVTVCATLLGGSYFLSIGENLSVTFIVFGYFISSILSYVIVQMLTNRTIKILHTYKGYLGFALVLAILMLGVKFDVIGYINKIPASNDVEEIYIGYNLNWWQAEDKSAFNKDIYDSESETGIYKDPKNIESITKLHKLILDNRSTNGSSEFIAYKLKNGEKIIRRYCIDTNMYASALAPVYESTEYKKNRFPILYQDVNNIKYVEIGDNRTQKTPLVLSEKDKLKTFKEALSRDITNLKYNDIVSDYRRTIFMDIIDIKNQRVPYVLHSSYTNTLAWLKQEGLYDQIVLKPTDLDSVSLEKVDFASENNNGGKSVSYGSKSVEISDKEVIAELLDLSMDSTEKNKSINYVVTFSQKNRSSYGDSLFIDYGKVSKKLQSYLDKMK